MIRSIFKNKIDNKNIKNSNFIEIIFNSKTTEINLYSSFDNKMVDSLLLDYGYFDIISNAYNKNIFFDENMRNLSINDFVTQHYNKLYPEIKNFVNKIEFLIISKMDLKYKIDTIKIKGDYAKDMIRPLKYNFSFKNCTL